MSLYLVRANAEGVCWCSCPEAPASPPGAGQLACPWCGCGWLFGCMLCRKAFTFARAVEVEPSVLEALVDLDRQRYLGGDVPEPPELRVELRAVAREAEERRRRVLKDGLDLELGREYVVLDGKVLPSDAKEIAFRGLFAEHKLSALPQAVYRREPGTIGRVLGRSYWQANELPARTR